MKAVFVTFEGGEGAGKSTLIEGMARALSQEGHSVLKVREPGGTRLGEEIRTLLLAKREGAPLSPYAELCLFLASRAQHLSEVILPALEEGRIVLCDRFNDSTIAYQGIARGLGREEVKRFCAFVAQGLSPDLTFYLDIEPAQGLARTERRGAKDRLEAEHLSFHAKIRKGYLELAREDPSRFRCLDARQRPEEILAAAMHFLHEMLSHV